MKAPQKVFDSLGELVQLKELEGGLSGVESLAFLEKLTKLEYFRVFAEAVDDLTPIVQTGDDGSSVVATWEGAEPSDPASGAKFYRVEAVEAAAE